MSRGHLTLPWHKFWRCLDDHFGKLECSPHTVEMNWGVKMSILKVGVLTCRGQVWVFVHVLIKVGWDYLYLITRAFIYIGSSLNLHKECKDIYWALNEMPITRHWMIFLIPSSSSKYRRWYKTTAWAKTSLSVPHFSILKSVVELSRRKGFQRNPLFEVYCTKIYLVIGNWLNLFDKKSPSSGKGGSKVVWKGFQLNTIGWKYTVQIG